MKTDLSSEGRSLFRDPEKYCQDILEASEFKKLKRLVDDSDETIEWKWLVGEGIVKIEGNKVVSINRKGGALHLTGNLKSLRKLKLVYGDLKLCDMEKLEDIGDIEYIGGNLYMDNLSSKFQIDILERIAKGKLTVKQGIYFGGTKKGIEKLLDYKEIPGSLDLEEANIKSLGKIVKIKGYLDCQGLKSLEDIGDLEEVGEWLILDGTSIKTLGNLKKVGGALNLISSKVESLGALEEVGGNLDIRGVSADFQIEVIKKINKGELKVKGLVTFFLKEEGIDKLLENEEIPGNLALESISIDQVGNLKKVKGDLDISLMPESFQGKILEKIEKGELEVIGDINFSLVTKFKEIPGNIYMSTAIKSLGKIRKIDGWLDHYGICSETLKDLGDLEEVGGSMVVAGASIVLQIQALYRERQGILKTDGIIVDEDKRIIFDKIYKNGNFENFNKVFGGDVNRIEDLESKQLAKDILLMEYNELKRKLKRSWDKIIEENHGKTQTEEEKKELRDKIKDLDLELKRMEEKIVSFMGSLDLV